MTGDRFRDLIIEVASPEALRNNLFRVLDLPTDVSNHALRRESERLELMQRFSDGESESGGEDTAGRRQEALRRLRDPAGRLVDELLWHWPEDADGGVGHNLAVDALHELAESDAAGAWAIDTYVLARDRMATALDDPATTAYLERRIETFGDPRLRAGDARELVEAARLLVPLLVLRSAVRAHQRGDASLVTRLVKMTRNRPDSATDAAATVALDPVLERLHAMIGAATVEAGATHVIAVERARTLVDETRADREIVDLVLAESDQRRLGVVDQLVEVARLCAIATFNETQGSATVVPFLRQLRALHPGPTALSDLDETVAQIEEEQRLLRQVLAQSGYPDMQTLLRQANAPAPRRAPAGAWGPDARAGYANVRPIDIDPTAVLGRRFLAFAVDYAALVWAGTSQASWLWIMVFILNMVVWQGLSGMTVGKAVFGPRTIVQMDGRPPGLVRATIRALPWVAAALLEAASGTYGPAYIALVALEGSVAVATTGRRRIGDLLAGTFVVHRSTPPGPFWPPERRDTAPTRMFLAAIVMAIGAVLVDFPDWEGGGNDDTETAGADGRTESSERTTTTADASTTTGPAPTTTTVPPTTTTTALRPLAVGECARPAPTPDEPARYAQVACDDPTATVQLIEKQPGFAAATICPADTDVVLEYTVTEFDFDSNGMPLPSLPETWCMRNL